MLGEEKDPKWMQNLWRPAMGWMYMLICLLDMAIFPVLWSLLQAMMHQPITQWNPLTLQGAGLFHVAMGAIIGVSAYGRTQEKLGGANNGGINLPSSGGTTYTPPAAIPQSTAPATVGTPVTNSWGSQPLGTGSGFGSAPSTGPGGNTGFGAPATADVVTGFGGKPAPVIPPFPER